MNVEAFREILVDRGEVYALEAILLASNPVLFPTPGDYSLWRQQVAASSGLVAEQVRLVGSAVTGFSLAPRKFGRAFRTYSSIEAPASDLDLVVVDSEIFHDCWAAVLHEDRRLRLRLSQEEKEKLHQDVYFGFISAKMAPRNADVYQRIIALRAECGRHPNTSGIRVNARLYHREEDFIGYQTASLRALKRSFKEHEG